MLRLAAVSAIVALGCGRTEPYRARLYDGGAGGAGGSGGTGGGSAIFEPLLVDLDQGVLTAHHLDGSAAFSRRLTSSHQRTFHLAPGAGVVGWLFREAGGTSFGLTQRDGATRFRTDTFGASMAWTSARGAVVSNGFSGLLVLGQTSRTFSLVPVEGATSTGQVPVIDLQRRLAWVTPSTGAAGPASDPPVPSGGARLVGDRLYHATAAGVIERTPTADLMAAAPFALPQVLAANAARQALLSDPTSSRLVVARFAPQVEVSPVKLESAGLSPMGTFTDRTLALDDEGRIYATFAAPLGFQVLRTATLGQTWEKVVEVPRSTLATTLRLEQRGRSLLVLGTVSRGPAVEDLIFAAVVSLTGLTQRELPLGGAQTALLPLFPVALSSDGAYAAFWALSASTMTLRRLEVASGILLDVETRPRPAGTPSEVLPLLTWLEGG